MSTPDRPLGELEQLVLLAILRVGDEAYAEPVRERLGRDARRHVARGALYTVLDRLEQKGFLRSRLGEALPERGGRPRRYFAVTAAGVAALRRTRKTLLGLWRGLDVLSEEP
ncbi:MAG TPA: helix-turn-helix transcriptional regulator [Thermoanaerobaculia bacterium]